LSAVSGFAVVLRAKTFMEAISTRHSDAKTRFMAASGRMLHLEGKVS
jgi:hypothetical protein